MNGMKCRKPQHYILKARTYNRYTYRVNSRTTSRITSQPLSITYMSRLVLRPPGGWAGIKITGESVRSDVQ